MAWRPAPSVVLTLNGGYVDTAGFLSLHGLFVAHVTGNFVTGAAALYRGTSGATAELLALPVFCVAVAATQVASSRLKRGHRTTLRILLGSQVALLALGGILAIEFGPFASGDGLPALCTGMTLVSAMAVQNAAHRVHLAEAPPSTLVTGSITQLMTDLTDVALGQAAQPDARARIARLATSVVAFALGCGVAALLCVIAGPWCFALPPLLAFIGMHLVCAGDLAAEAAWARQSI